jgi:hypothetical protein
LSFAVALTATVPDTVAPVLGAVIETVIGALTVDWGEDKLVARRRKEQVRITAKHLFANMNSIYLDLENTISHLGIGTRDTGTVRA